MMSIPDYCRKILRINLRIIMQLLIQPFHFMSNVENLHISRSVFQSTVLTWFFLCINIILNGIGYEMTSGGVEKKENTIKVENSKSESQRIR